MEENTKYAGPTRSTREESEASLTLLRSKDFFKEVFGAINSIAAILDKNRLVVFANDLFLKTMGFDSLESLLGKRPGEAISCIHSAEEKYGCGTSAACSVCGAVNAIIESQETNKKVSRETRITALKDGNTISWDLKVTSSPVSFFR